MKKIFFVYRYFLQCKAVTGVEYALIAAGISLTIMLTVIFFGDTLRNTFVVMFEVLSAYLQTAT